MHLNWIITLGHLSEKMWEKVHKGATNIVAVCAFFQAQKGSIKKGEILIIPSFKIVKIKSIFSFSSKSAK